MYETKEAASLVWTLAHGHFLVMGGFHLVEPREEPTEANTDTAQLRGPPASSSETTDTENAHGPDIPERVTILSLETLEKLVKDPEFEIQITEDEITDRSKGDALSKLIFILQSTWFILQCVGRWVQGLNVTQLELTTVALASLNGITFALWWDKPLGARTPVCVYLKRKLREEERPTPGSSTRSDVRIIPKLAKIFESCSKIIRDAFLCRPDKNIFALWFFFVPLAIFLLLLLPIFAFTYAFLATLLDLSLRAASSFPDHAKHVPTFYVPEHRYPKWYHVLLLVTLAAIFGGIHCVGWNFSFPTYKEQKIWRVASLLVTILPFTAVPLFLILDFITDRPSVPKAVRAFVVALGLFTILLSALTYVAARLALLALALSLLRRLSPSAFVVINWSMFYPHFL